MRLSNEKMHHKECLALRKDAAFKEVKRARLVAQNPFVPEM